jgi:hypothetical protein
MTDYFSMIWIPACVGLLLAFYFTSMFIVFRKYYNLNAFKETVHTKSKEIFSFVIPCLISIVTLSFIIYFTASLISRSFLNNYIITPVFLYYLTAILTISFLVLARTAGANGLTWIATSLHYIMAIGISTWLIIGVIDAFSLFDISFFTFDIPRIDFMLSILFSGLIALAINEFFLWLQIHRKIEIFKNITPTLPIIDLFSRVSEVKNYIGRKQLIDHVLESINTSNNGLLEIAWLTGTLDRDIQKGICDFLHRDSSNNVKIRILCNGVMFDNFPIDLNDDFKKFVTGNRIEIAIKPFEPGFWRAICIGNRVICGLTTGDQPEARTGFDAIRPLDYLSLEFFENIWKNEKNIKEKIE